MLNVQRLPVLTQLRLTGAGNLVGDVPVAMLALCLPPDLAVLQLAADYVSWPLVCDLPYAWWCENSS